MNWRNRRTIAGPKRARGSLLSFHVGRLKKRLSRRRSDDNDIPWWFAGWFRILFTCVVRAIPFSLPLSLFQVLFATPRTVARSSQVSLRSQRESTALYALPIHLFSTSFSRSLDCSICHSTEHRGSYKLKRAATTTNNIERPGHLSEVERSKRNKSNDGFCHLSQTYLQDEALSSPIAARAHQHSRRRKRWATPGCTWPSA